MERRFRTMPRRSTRAAVMSGLLFVLVSSGDAAAGPATRRSSAKVLFEATVADSASGRDVAMLGLVRVQTKVRPADESLEVRASIREEAFLAYATDGQEPANPVLDALKQRERDLKQQIVDLRGQLDALEQELAQVLATDIFPLVPGHQIDRERAAELRSTMSQVSAALKRLLRELAAVQKELESLLADLQKQQDPAVGYRAFGKQIIGPSSCAGLVCERLLTFGLVRPDGGSAPFQVRLRLQFSQQGRLVSDQTERGCETTLICGVDGGECFCP